MARREDDRWKGNPFADVEPGGKLLIFGRPTMMWDDAPTPEEYYRSYGFSDVHTLDVSPYEGATFIHDLNNPNVPDELCGQYRAVLSGGTIEHVFNVWSVFQVAHQLLEIGGVFKCGAPANNWVDHGFWQISPTLKFDFFSQNGYEFGDSVGSFRNVERRHLRSFPIYPGEGQILNRSTDRAMHILSAIKTPTSTANKIPLQSLYLDKHSGAFMGWKFRPSVPADTIEQEIIFPAARRFSIAPDAIKRRNAGCFAWQFREERLFPSIPPRKPFRSKALVYEDDRLLPWIVSSEDLVAATPGAFAHIGAFILFSTPDGSDPRENGRTYEVVFPQPFKGMQPYGHDPLYPDAFPSEPEARANIAS